MSADQLQDPPLAGAASALLPEAARQDWQLISSRIQAVRLRHRLKFVAGGLFLGSALFAAAFLGFSLVDVLFKVSVGTRVFWMALTLGAVTAGLFLTLVRPWRAMGGPLPIARQIEGAFPQLEQQLSTALEFGGDPEYGRIYSSPELVGALVQQARARSAPLNFGRTVRWRPVLWAALVAFLAAGGVTLYAALEARLFHATWQRFIHPLAALPAPTLTVIQSVSPGSALEEVPVETSVPISVQLSGVMPETAILSVCLGDLRTAPWEDRVMMPGGQGAYHATLRRLLDTAHYRIRAGDAESGVYSVGVYREPQVDEFSIRIEYPAYTGRPPEQRLPGMGEITALKGSKAILKLKANTEPRAARVRFLSERKPATGVLTGREAEIAFAITANDRYQIQIEDRKGRENRSPTLYRIQVVEDAAPTVRILKPERDLMVHKTQEVNVEIGATDDLGVREVGLFHSLGLDEEKTLVKRWDPAPTQGKGFLKWELSRLGLKGGEVIAYYAYALDNDTLDGPKLAKSELHFLTIYDEEEYQSTEQPDQKSPPTPQSVKRLDKMIEDQKKLLQETFGLARRQERGAKGAKAGPEPPGARRENGGASEQPKGPGEAEQKQARSLGSRQQQLKKDLEELTAQVKEQLQEAGEDQQPKPDGPPPGGKPEMGEKELKHMEASAERMGQSAQALEQVKADAAVRSEIEALRHLSETRRLLLSEKEGDPRFKKAMDRQAKKNRNKQRTQREQDQQAARDELTELPPMMEREKQVERELDALEELERKQKQPAQKKEQDEDLEREEQRRQMRRKTKEELEQLAEEARKREENLRELAKRNPEIGSAADHLQDAAEQFQKAQRENEKGERPAAREESRKANRNLQQAQKNLRDALEQQLRQELENLHRDAQDLAQRQAGLEQQTRDQTRREESVPQPGKEQPGKEQAGKEQAGKEQTQPASGAQAQPSGNPAPSGAASPGAQRQAEREAQQRALAGRQQEVGEDLQELGHRIQQVSERAKQASNAGAEALEEARRQADREEAAQQSALKAAQALRSGRGPEALHEQHKAERALEAIARSLREAIQNSQTADLKELAQALKQGQQLAREQGEVAKGVEERRDPAQLGARETTIARGAQELAEQAKRLEALKQAGRAQATQEQLGQAGEKAGEAAKALAGQDTQGAREPVQAADKALQNAVAQLERSIGKTLEDKAREALEQAKAAREEQERAAETSRTLPDRASSQEPGTAWDQAARERRDESAAHQRQAARHTRQLQDAVKGLEQLAGEANPAAGQVAQEAREQIEKDRLPQRMEDLVRELEQLGEGGRADSERRSQAAPQELARQGKQLGERLKDLEKKLNQFIAESTGDQLARLQALEQEARQAAAKAKELAQAQAEQQAGKREEAQPKPPAEPKQDAQQGAPSDPAGKEKGKEQGKEHDPAARPESQATQKDPAGPPKASGAPEQADPRASEADPNRPSRGSDSPEEQMESLAKDLKRLQPKLERLEPDAREKGQLQLALEQLREAQRGAPVPHAERTGRPMDTPQSKGGAALERTRRALEDVVGGLGERIERILKAREVHPSEDENAPKEYVPLVDDYYRALSEDMEE